MPIPIIAPQSPHPTNVCTKIMASFLMLILPMVFLFPLYSSRKYPAGFFKTLAILIRVFMDGSDAPVSYQERVFCYGVPQEKNWAGGTFNPRICQKEYLLPSLLAQIGLLSLHPSWVVVRTHTPPYCLLRLS